MLSVKMEILFNALGFLGSGVLAALYALALQEKTTSDATIKPVFFQPINALAFIFDGLHSGVSYFPYAAYSMMLVGVVSSVFLLYAPRVLGLPGVWYGLTLIMGLRMATGFIRLLDPKGPWCFLHRDIKELKKDT